MSENLYLRLGQQQGADFLEWLILDDASDEVRVRGQGDFETFAANVPTLLSEGDWRGQVFAMLRGEDVLLTKANVPSKQQRQILRAVPFMVEEQLASDVEDCHFAVGKRDSDGHVGVAVVERDLISQYITELDEAGIKLQFFGIDCLSVAKADGCTIMMDQDRAMIRSGENDVICVDRDMTTLAVNLLPDEVKQQFTLSLHESEIDENKILVSQLEAEYDAEVSIVEREYECFEALCRNLDRTNIDLLQGEFKVDQPKNQTKSPWRNVFILAASACAIHLAIVLGQGVYLANQADAYEAQARALYKEVFPSDRNVRDLKRRWRSHLQASGGDTGADFLTLFAETTRNIPGSPLTLHNVSFSEGRGYLTLQLETRRSDQLIAFSETLGKLGLSAEIGTINQGDESVKGSIKVSNGRKS